MRARDLLKAALSRIINLLIGHRFNTFKRMKLEINKTFDTKGTIGTTSEHDERYFFQPTLETVTANRVSFRKECEKLFLRRPFIVMHDLFLLFLITIIFSNIKVLSL